ncbi:MULTISPECIES: hypothetical protein [Sorangium]|uniref:Uncharacterized protein n=1 Tax=Sorangium cellulosum TaxID=56 RepID=A0A4P2QYX9_SORCE|nr:MULTISPECIES: hypothetical protein [Sorangium]AUX35789.1 uncharacterized protein SOCE836_079880 [Sorangium cellulosum]WCQ95088.1 hypothetical protein NQZ70_07863 [Sorangium sp. Soce836]
MSSDTYTIGEPLNVRVGSAIYPGNDAGPAFLVKRAEGDLLQQEQAITWEGPICNWRRVGVIANTKDKARFFILEPADEYDELLFEGFYVKGKFRIAHREDNTHLARDAYRAFQAQ